jgi:hypothetical protein
LLVTPPGSLENNVLVEVMPLFLDQWKVLRPGDRGATFDGTNNGCVHDKEEVMRYDRVMLKDDPYSSLVGLRIDMIGTDAINEENVKPSDHYGILFDCVVNNDKRIRRASMIDKAHAWFKGTYVE